MVDGAVDSDFPINLKGNSVNVFAVGLVIYNVSLSAVSRELQSLWKLAHVSDESSISIRSRMLFPHQGSVCEAFSRVSGLDPYQTRHRIAPIIITGMYVRVSIFYIN